MYSRGVTHKARLLREKRLLPGELADDLFSVVSQALDELKDELGIDL